MEVYREDCDYCSKRGASSTTRREMSSTSGHTYSAKSISQRSERWTKQEIGHSDDQDRMRTSSSRTSETCTTNCAGRITMPNRRSRTRPSLASPFLILVSVIVSTVLWSRWVVVHCQCPDKTMTSFERIGGVTIKDAQLSVLYQANMSQATIGHHHHHHNQQAALLGALNQSTVTTTTLYQISTPITAECNNRCRRMKECRAFLVDYSRHTCWSVNHPASAGSHHQQAPSSTGVSNSGLSNAGMSSASFVLDRSPAPIHLELTNERTAYFEKVCLNLPIVECERAWIFERVLSYHIHGYDDKIIEDVPSRLKCQEHCLNERRFRCRSGEYDMVTMQCRLSSVDRHMKESQFRPAANNIDYFENQCVPTGQQCDAFDRFEDTDLGRAEIMRVVNNSEQCQQFCTQTIKAFICRSFTWSPLTGRCYLNSANTFMVGGMDKLLQAPGLVYYQRNDCLDLKLECDTSSMTLNLRTNEPFRGRMYVRDGDPQACAPTLGRSALMSSLSIPFQSPMGRCATRELPSRYSSVVVVQQHPLIQRKSDRYIKLVCDFQTANKTISSSYNVLANPWTSTALINATSFAPKILLRITDKFGHDVTGAKLGDELQLRIEAETDSPYDMAARSVLAKSGSSDAESIVLIDRDGCPADFRIFPPLKKLDKRTIIGRFDAFKFSSDAVVRFQVDVQFCLNSCPQTNCLDASQTLFNVNSQQLEGTVGNGDQTAQQQQQQSSTVPIGSSTTSSPTHLVQQLAPGNNQNGGQDEANPLEYMRSTSTTYRPDYLASNSLLDQYVGQLTPDNSLLGTRRGQPPANQPLGGQDVQVPQPSASQTIMAAMGGSRSQQPTSDQLFDPQVKDSGRLLAPALNQQQHYNHPKYVNQKQVAANQQQQHKQIYGGSQAMHSNGLDQLDQLSPAEMDAAQQDQNSHRRRRRSTEPMPTAPKHVPLQREIIIFDRTSANKEGQVADKGQRSSSGSPAAATGGNKQQAQAAANKRDRSDSKPTSSKSSSERKANNDQGSLEFSVNRYDLNQAEQLGSGNRLDGTSASNQEQADVSRALVCTTWATLAYSLLAFCVIQLLAIGIYLATWLHKNKFKQADARLTTLANDDPRNTHQKFLNQILHHHHHQQQQQQHHQHPQRLF